jgi:hypothetical protein
MTSAHRAGAHERILGMLFEHPMSHNIEWRDVLQLLDAIGSTKEGGHDTVHATVNGKTVILHGTHHKALGSEQVMQLRHFLRDAGVQPAPATKGP